jgi:hypothetical protein
VELYPVGERFFQELTLRQVLLNAAKNGCGPSAAGTSSLVEGPNTAKPVATTASPAPLARLERTGSSARTASTPCHQEHEAWHVLLACQGQLRLAPSGDVVGIDINAALKLGAAWGRDLAVLSELLPAAEAGLVEALCTDQGRVMDFD